MYVIKRSSDGKYVTLPGSEHSYTTSLKQARKFATRESAARCCCENEYAVSVHEEINA